MQDLEEKLVYYLTNDHARLRLVSQLREKVLAKHTYDARSHELVGLLNRISTIRYWIITEISQF